MDGESKRDRMTIDRDIDTDTFYDEEFLTGERSALKIENEENDIVIRHKAFNTCKLEEISIGRNAKMYTSAFYHCRIKRFIIQADAPRPTETIFWECFIETLIVQQGDYNLEEGWAQVHRLVHRTDKATRISNVLLIFRGGSKYLWRRRTAPALRM